MSSIWGKKYNKIDLLSRLGDIRQIAGVIPFQLTEGNERGVRAVRLYNDTGLDFTVVSDRGLSITQLAFQGVPLAYLSPVGTANPSFQELSSTGWLRVWPGGFLTTCGLTQVGRAHEDQDEFLGTHGRVASTPARMVNQGGRWEGEDYLLWVEGLVRETRVFGENIVMHRKIWTKLGEPTLWIEDTVTNDGFSPVPHMFLQHFNLSFPLISADTRLHLPQRVTLPRDEVAQPGLDSCCEFSDPIPGYNEQVFYHDLTPNAQGLVNVKVVNPSLGDGKKITITFEYLKKELPILVEWKMMRQGMYVLGVEPSNCHVGGRAKEREMGSLIHLDPQESRTYRIKVSFDIS